MQSLFEILYHLTQAKAHIERSNRKEEEKNISVLELGPKTDLNEHNRISNFPSSSQVVQLLSATPVSLSTAKHSCAHNSDNVITKRYAWITEHADIIEHADK